MDELPAGETPKEEDTPREESEARSEEEEDSTRKRKDGANDLFEGKAGIGTKRRGPWRDWVFRHDAKPGEEAGVTSKKEEDAAK